MECLAFSLCGCLLKGPDKEKRRQFKLELLKDVLQQLGMSQDGLEDFINGDQHLKLSEILQNSGQEADFDALMEQRSYQGQGYELWPDTVDVLQEFKQEGKTIVLWSNSTNKGKVSWLLKNFGLDQFIDSVILPQDIGYKKQNPLALESIMAKISTSNDKIHIVSSQLNKEIKLAVQNQIKCTWIALGPSDNQDNVNYIDELDSYQIQAISCLRFLKNSIQFRDSAQIKCGYIFPTLKKRLWALNVSYNQKNAFQSNEQVHYNYIEINADLEKQGQYDVIINKCVDLLTANTLQTLKKLEKFQLYLLNNSNLPVIDHPDTFEIAASRSNFNYKISQVLQGGIQFKDTRIRLPWNMDIPQITSNTPQDILQEMNQFGIQFPIFLKTNSAQQTEKSHYMIVVMTEKGLQESILHFDEDLIAQEFINHNGTVYKGYTLGDMVTYFPRKSCSNIAEITQDYVQFLSDQPWPAGLLSNEEPIVLDLDMDIVRKCSEILHDNIGVSIFGFDILVQAGTGDFVLIDLNQFPGFKEIKDVSDLMRNHVMASYNRGHS